MKKIISLMVVLWGIIIPFYVLGQSQSHRTPLDRESFLKLAQTVKNLNYIWNISKYRSEKYEEIHNTFVNTYRQFSSQDINSLPALILKCSEEKVDYIPETKELICLEIGLTPPEIGLEELKKNIDLSYRGSQAILTEYYLNDLAIIETAKEIKNNLKKATQADPDSALADFIPMIEGILNYAAKVSRGELPVEEVCIIKSDSLLRETEFLIRIEERLRKELGSKISFPSGKYEEKDFNEQGRKVVDTLIDELLRIKEKFPLQYPGQTLIVTIKTVGYTDQLPIRNEELIEKLRIGVDIRDIPKDSLELDRFLNERLSKFRAKTVNEYAQKKLLEKDWGDSVIQIEQDIVGKGEELPPGLVASDDEEDERRRISKISAVFRRLIPFFENSSCFPKK